MSNELPPPPPPPPPPAEGNDSLPSAPKLKLNKPGTPVAPLPLPAGAPLPPPPSPTAGAPIPPPPPTAAPAPMSVPAAAARPNQPFNNRTVGKAAAAIDILAFTAALAGVVFLAFELFIKPQG